MSDQQALVFIYLRLLFTVVILFQGGFFAFMVLLHTIELGLEMCLQLIHGGVTQGTHVFPLLLQLFLAALGDPVDYAHIVIGLFYFLFVMMGTQFILSPLKLSFIELFETIEAVQVILELGSLFLLMMFELGSLCLLIIF